MAIRAVKRESEYKYIPVDEREAEKPTAFYFKPLDKETKAKLEDKLVVVMPDETINVANSSYLLGAIKLCLVKVENFVDEKDREIPVKRCKDGLVCDDWLDLLPDDILNGLGQTIINVSKYPDKASLFLGE